MPTSEKRTKQSTPANDQRQKLEQSEREAAKGGAENYQDAERDAKVVSTGQDDPNDVGSIKKIDNDQARKAGKSK